MRRIPPFDQRLNFCLYELPLLISFLCIHEVFFCFFRKKCGVCLCAGKKEDFFGTFLKQNDLINKGQEGGLCNHFEVTLN